MVWGRAASTDVLFSGSSDSTIKVRPQVMHAFSQRMST